jgi:hypothetical protein
MASSGNVFINGKLYRNPVAVRFKAHLSLATEWPVTGMQAAEKTWQAMRAFTGAAVRAKSPDVCRLSCLVAWNVAEPAVVFELSWW